MNHQHAGKIKKSVSPSRGRNAFSRGFSSGLGNLYWDHLLDEYLAFNRSGLRSYRNRNISSQVVRTFNEGDQLLITYFTFVDGVTWIGYFDYSINTYAWIPLFGATGDGIIIPVETMQSAFYVSNIKTVEQIQAEEDAANQTVFDKFTGLFKTIGFGLAGLMILSSLTKSNDSQK
jgi:hypothetical protein